MDEIIDVLQQHEQNLKEAHEAHDPRLIGNALSRLGQAYQKLGEGRRAIVFYEQALAIAREIGDRGAESATLGNLANIHATQGDFNRAIVFYEQALAIAREIGDRRAESATLGNLGNIYAMKGDSKHAIEFYNRALAIADEDHIIQSDPNYVALYQNRGNAYSSLNDYQQAIADYDRIIELDPDNETAHVRKEDVLAAFQAAQSSIKRGDVVDGVIVRIDPDEILVDIGLKSEGVLSTKELPASGDWSFENLHVNDKVLVYVIQPETPDGHALLSLKRANAERQWRIAEEQYKNNELLQARIIDYNKGGLIVDAAGIRGFVPISQILNLTRLEVTQGGDNQVTAAKLASMNDKVLQLKIIEINRARNRLILSERLANQEWRQRRREELLDELKPGEVRTGVVSNLANFGAFVDLGGADGLVHISQLAWSRANHPSEVLKVGQEVEVQVLSVDKEKKKIALSIKRAEVDPWTTVEQRYHPGQIVTGTITKIAPFGAFARLEDSIEGLIHVTEIPSAMDPLTFFHEDQQLQFRILRIDAERRRIGLSLYLDPSEKRPDEPVNPSENSSSDETSNSASQKTTTNTTAESESSATEA